MPYSTTDSNLSEVFSKMGKVTSTVVITDRNTGRSKGFGFVDMENDAEAEKAIKELNGSDLDGRAIVVSEARPKQE